ncbi:hypothetical protein EAE92_11925 [Photorhabdus hainanensis]|nr:hypothetical protein [Photorhabdus hainanensis]
MSGTFGVKLTAKHFGIYHSTIVYIFSYFLLHDRKLVINILSTWNKKLCVLRPFTLDNIDLPTAACIEVLKK